MDTNQVCPVHICLTVRWECCTKLTVNWLTSDLFESYKSSGKVWHLSTQQFDSFMSVMYCWILTKSLWMHLNGIKIMSSHKKWMSRLSELAKINNESQWHLSRYDKKISGIMRVLTKLHLLHFSNKAAMQLRQQKQCSVQTTVTAIHRNSGSHLTVLSSEALITCCICGSHRQQRRLLVCPDSTAGSAHASHMHIFHIHTVT